MDILRISMYLYFIGNTFVNMARLVYFTTQYSVTTIKEYTMMSLKLDTIAVRIGPKSCDVSFCR